MRAGDFVGVPAVALAVTIALAGCGTQTDGADPPGSDAASSEAVVAGFGVRAEAAATGDPETEVKADAERRAPSASTRGAPQPFARSVGQTWRVVCGQGGLGLQSAIDAAAPGDTIRVIGDCDEPGIVEGKDLSIVRDPLPGSAAATAGG